MKCEGSPIGTSILSRPRTGDCCDRVARYVMPFGRTFGIALTAALISRSGSFVAISPTSPALGQLKRLAAREWLLNAKPVMRWSRSASTSHRGLDGLPYEVYLRMSHMFVPILTDMFNHWFAQGAIPGSVTKGVITLLKKGGRHVWEGLDDYRPITLLNTELKILAKVFANCLQLVISDLIGPEQTFAVKGRSFQNNLHLIRKVLEGIKDDTEAALISLDQSKAFDRVEHRFLATVLETAGFKSEFRRWISMMYHNPQAVVQVDGRRFGALAIERSVRQGCPLSPLLYVLTLEPLLRRPRDEGTSPALRDVPFTGRLTARVFTFADDIPVSVSRRLDIEAVKEAVVEYERIAGAKVNFEKSKGFGSVLGGVAILFQGPSAWVTDPSASSGCSSGPTFNWSEIGRKYMLRWMLRWESGFQGGCP